MIQTRLQETHLDRTVRTTATALRYLAYAMFAASIIGAWLGSDVKQDGRLVVTSGAINATDRPRLSQFVDDVIPHLVWSALVLAVAVLIQIAMYRNRVGDSASTTAVHESSATTQGDEMWQPRNFIDS